MPAPPKKTRPPRDARARISPGSKGPPKAGFKAKDAGKAKDGETRRPEGKPRGKPQTRQAAPAAAPAAQASQGSPHARPASERIARALARTGLASRRDVERMIAEGRIAVNGQVLTTPAVNVTPNDILTVDGKVAAEAEAARLWRYHKPIGLLTTHKDPKGRATVFDNLPTGMPRVISVGRLDINSEGLLLLTNDGDLARSLEMPSSGWVRRYRARAYGRITQERLDSLRDGVVVDGVAYGPMSAVLEREPKDPKVSSNLWILVSITEGKNREVRKVMEHVGLLVNRLIRVAYGPFELGELEPGAVAEIPPAAIRKTLSSVLPPERMPKGEGRLFNAGPDRAVRPARGRPADAGGDDKPRPSGQKARRVSPSRERYEARAEAFRAKRPPKEGDDARPPRAGKAPVRSPDGAKEKPVRKAGWAKPKPKAVHKPAGPKKPRGR